MIIHNEITEIKKENEILKQKNQSKEINNNQNQIQIKNRKRN